LIKVKATEEGNFVNTGILKKTERIKKVDGNLIKTPHMLIFNQYQYLLFNLESS
jgi:hypothetical protein